MKTIGVDPDCVELARKFLVDEQTRVPVSAKTAARNLTSLSEHIQRAVDDWFEAQNWEPGGFDWAALAKLRKEGEGPY
jgi:hypothetical protein